MFPYMIDKENTGIYRLAFDYALKAFASKNPVEMARNSGSDFDSERSIISLQSLGQGIDVHFPDGHISFSDSTLSPVWYWRFIILHYLSRADNAPLFHRFISYRELESGETFYPAFLRESIKPLADLIIRETAERVKLACHKLGDCLDDRADVSAVFFLLPRFPVRINIWSGDEEIEASANILFDLSANHYLHTEDIAAAGHIVSSFLIKQCELMAQANTGGICVQ